HVADAAKRVGTLIEKPSDTADHVEYFFAAEFALQNAALGQMSEITHFGQHGRTDSRHFEVADMITICPAEMGEHPCQLMSQRPIALKLSDLNQPICIAPKNFNSVVVGITAATARRVDANCVHSLRFWGFPDFQGHLVPVSRLLDPATQKLLFEYVPITL